MIENQIAIIWKVLLWGLGICATGFFVLLGIVIKASKDVYTPVKEIRDALLGTLYPNEPGLITKYYRLKEEFDKHLERCHARHEQNA